MEVEHNQHIGIYRKAIPKEFCDETIKFFHDHGNFHNSRQVTDKVPVLDKKDQQLVLPDYAVTNDSWYHHRFAEIFYKDIYSEYRKAYPEIDHAGDNYLRFFKMQETKPGGGYHVWHYEYSHSQMSRIAVWTLYLNDDFEAGETEFLHQQCRVKPETGTVCIFPASYTHLHRGNPPIGGTKYIATGWLEL